MKKFNLIVPLMLVLLTTGAGCETQSSKIIDNQQGQIESLNKRVEELSGQLTSSTTTSNSFEEPISVRAESDEKWTQDSTSIEDPIVKIERCKISSELKAIDSADKWMMEQLGVLPSDDSNVTLEKLNRDPKLTKTLLSWRDNEKKEEFYKVLYNQCLSSVD